MDLSFIGKSLWQVAELVVPQTCASCRTYGPQLYNNNGLCPACSQLIRISLLNIHIPTLRLPLENVVAAGVYEHELARVILAFKNEGRYDQRRILGSGLSRCVQLILEANDYPQTCVLVPVPSSPKNTKKRGYSPAEILAQTARQDLRLQGVKSTRVIPAVAVRRKATTSSGQKNLGAQARWKRINRSMVPAVLPSMYFGASLNLHDVPCIVCDDVVTTGASLVETARVLKEMGARVIGYASVAAVPRRSEEIKE